jgi:hypothetical protein
MAFDLQFRIDRSTNDVDQSARQRCTRRRREQHWDFGAIGGHRQDLRRQARRQVLQFHLQIAAEIGSLRADQKRRAIALRHGNRGVDVLLPLGQAHR